MTEHKGTRLRQADRWSIGVKTGGITVCDIRLRCDGHGPMGYYDVIYIYSSGDSPFAAMPAHNVEFWKY